MNTSKILSWLKKYWWVLPILPLVLIFLFFRKGWGWAHNRSQTPAPAPRVSPERGEEIKEEIFEQAEEEIKPIEAEQDEIGEKVDDLLDLLKSQEELEL